MRKRPWNNQSTSSQARLESSPNHLSGCLMLFCHWHYNMEPKNGGVEDDFPFQLGDSYSMLIFGGVYYGYSRDVAISHLGWSPCRYNIFDMTWRHDMTFTNMPLGILKKKSRAAKAIGRFVAFLLNFGDTNSQLMVNCWFGSRWFGFLESPNMKGIGILGCTPIRIPNH